MIEQDHKNAEIIKPVLSGRDIKRYQVNFNDFWLIFIPWHFPFHEESNIKGASNLAEEEFKITYNGLYIYLSAFKDKLSKRNKSETGVRYEWYALQRCAATYYKHFAEEKIVAQKQKEKAEREALRKTKKHGSRKNAKPDRNS